MSPADEAELYVTIVAAALALMSMLGITDDAAIDSMLDGITELDMHDALHGWQP